MNITEQEQTERTFNISVTETELRQLEDAVCYADDNMTEVDYESCDFKFTAKDLRELWRSLFRVTEGMY